MGHGSEERRYGGHHDGAESQETALPDGVVRRVALMARADGEIDHHDAFFFTTPNSMMMPTNAYRSSSLWNISSVSSAPKTADGSPRES